MSPTVSAKTVRSWVGRCHGHIPARDFDHWEEDSQEPCILAEGNRHKEPEQHQDSSHQKEDLKVKSLQRTVFMMMKRTNEQITDVTRGNTAAPRWDRPVPLKNSRQYSQHSQRRETRSREDSQWSPRTDATAFKVDQPSRSGTNLNLVNKMDYDFAESKGSTRSRTGWRGFHRKEHPQTSQNVEDGTSGTDGANGTNDDWEMMTTENF